MPKTRLLSGFFQCPHCKDEFALERVPELEAICDECQAPLEALEEEDA